MSTFTDYDFNRVEADRQIRARLQTIARKQSVIEDTDPRIKEIERAACRAIIALMREEIAELRTKWNLPV